LNVARLRFRQIQHRPAKIEPDYFGFACFKELDAQVAGSACHVKNLCVGRQQRR
jgi:hypothetical protein